MQHAPVLSLALVFLLAAALAVPLFRRLGLGAVLGYLAAGVVIGPHVLALAPDPDGVLALSEWGVVMMLFVIGLELSPARLWVMRRAVFGAGSLQVALSGLALGAVLLGLGLGWKAASVLGVGLALSSTAVGLQLLAERKELVSDHGRLSFAVLLFQDIIAIPLLAAIPLLGSAKAAAQALPSWDAVLQAVLVIVGVIVVGRLLLRHALRAVARTRTVEVFTASTLAVVAGTAWVMQYAGLSAGLGAFLAGLLLADSEFRHELESHIEPFKGLLLGLFFMAVGMGIDLQRIAREPLLIAGAVLGLVLLKIAILLLVGRLSGLPWRRALMFACVLGMGGEFAFVVFAEAFRAGLIDVALRDRLVVVVGLSMALTPLLMMGVGAWLRRLPAREPARPYDTIDHEHPRVIVAGFGRVGQIVGRLLRAHRIPFTALENSPEQVDFSRRFGSTIYFGDPARPDILRAAHAERAEVFVVATDDPEASLRTARLVKRMYPHLKVLARARNRQHAFRLMDMGLDGIVRETYAGSLELGQQVLEALGIPPEQAADRTRRFRVHDEALLARQYLLYDDEAALVASSRDALKELESLFEADLADDRDAAAEGDGPPRA